MSNGINFIALHYGVKYIEFILLQKQVYYRVINYGVVTFAVVALFQTFAPPFRSSSTVLSFPNFDAAACNDSRSVHPEQ